MEIADNIIKESLKNVYWIGGTACGGKTTMARSLSKKYNMEHYNVDEMYDYYRSIANVEEQPGLCKKFKDANEYFSRPQEEYVEYLNQLNRESFGMIIVDLIKSLSNKSIIVEGHYPPEAISNISTYNKIAFLYADEDIIRSDYMTRKDKRDMLDYINTTSDSDHVINHVLDVVVGCSKIQVEMGKQFDIKFFKRDKNTTVEDRLNELETHFGLATK